MAAITGAVQVSLASHLDMCKSDEPFDSGDSMFHSGKNMRHIPGTTPSPQRSRMMNRGGQSRGGYGSPFVSPPGRRRGGPSSPQRRFQMQEQVPMLLPGQTGAVTAALSEPVDGLWVGRRASYRDQLRANGQALQHALSMGPNDATPRAMPRLGMVHQEVPQHLDNRGYGDASTRQPCYTSTEFVPPPPPPTAAAPTPLALSAALGQQQQPPAPPAEAGPPTDGMPLLSQSSHPPLGGGYDYDYDYDSGLRAPFGSPQPPSSVYSGSRSPVRSRHDLLSIAMPQGLELNCEEIAERLRAALPAAYED